MCVCVCVYVCMCVCVLTEQYPDSVASRMDFCRIPNIILTHGTKSKFYEHHRVQNKTPSHIIISVVRINSLK